MAEVKVTIDRNKYHADIQIRNHSLVGDEPVEEGGKNDGPKASEMLLASLGSCTVITLRMYADRKEWPLEGVELNLSMERETVNGKLNTAITNEIKFIGDLTEEQRKRLLMISEKCPIHKVLNSPVVIHTSEI